MMPIEMMRVSMQTESNHRIKLSTAKIQKSSFNAKEEVKGFQIFVFFDR